MLEHNGRFVTFSPVPSRLTAVLERVAHPKALSLAQGLDDATLSELYARGAEAHSTLRLSDEAFVRQLGRMLRRSGLAYPLASLNAADLYLCAACLEAQPKALEAFEKGPLKRALASLTAQQRDEVRQLVLEKLLLGPKPRLLEYSGQGALVVWLSLVARRTAMNAGRGTQRETAMDEGDEARAGVAELLAQSPELQLGKKVAQAEVVSALRGALKDLEPKERELLRLFHLQGVPHDQIGLKLKAPRSTVAYWLTRARQKLLEGTRRRLAESLKLTSIELDSLVRAMGSRMDLSLHLTRNS